MWDLTDVHPPIFEHSPNGCCVVLGQTTDEKEKSISHKVYQYSGNYINNPFRILLEQIDFKESAYFKNVQAGVIYRPFCYFQVLKRTDLETGLSQIITQKGTKSVWKGCGYDGYIESKCLLPLIDSKHLKKLNYEEEMWLIAPLDKKSRYVLVLDKLGENLNRKKLYPHLHRYWKKCQKQYDEKRDIGKSKPILEMNYGFNKDLEDELSRCGDDSTKRKVVYNSSGKTLRAIRIPCNVIANSKLYYILCKSADEAQYLVGIINAPIMQSAWRKTKTSEMDYHKSPFKSIPVPLFDSSNILHVKIAEEIDRLENLNTVPNFSGLDHLLKELLPYYADLKDN